MWKTHKPFDILTGFNKYIQRFFYSPNPWYQLGRCISAITVVKAIAIIKPSWVEVYYAHVWYPIWHRCISTITTSLPFSLTDIFTFLLLYRLLFHLFKLIKQPHHVPRLLLFVSKVYLLFLCSWGLHYSRDPILQLKPRDNQEYLTQLYRLSLQLAKRANYQYQKCQNAAFNWTYFDYPQHLFEGCSQACSQWPASWICLPKQQPMVLKTSMYASMMSQLGTSGYVGPFTLESHLNFDIPPPMRPAVACHELAHQQGVASEGFCNYMAYWATQHSRESAVIYSGNLLMLLDALRTLRAYRPLWAEQINRHLSSRVLADVQMIKAYWRRHQSPLREFSSVFYDLFLKWNHQSKGIQEYGMGLQWLLQYPVQPPEPKPE